MERSDLSGIPNIDGFDVKPSVGLLQKIVQLAFGPVPLSGDNAPAALEVLFNHCVAEATGRADEKKNVLRRRCWPGESYGRSARAQPDSFLLLVGLDERSLDAEGDLEAQIRAGLRESAVLIVVTSGTEKRLVTMTATGPRTARVRIVAWGSGVLVPRTCARVFWSSGCSPSA